MTQVIKDVHVGDSITLLGVTLKYVDNTNTLVARDTTGLTVKVKIFNAATGVEVVALTETGVATVSDVNGQHTYDFTAGDITAAGIYRMYWVVTSGAETDHYPVKPDDYLVRVSTDLVDGQDAYDAAVAAL